FVPVPAILKVIVGGVTPAFTSVIASRRRQVFALPVAQFATFTAPSPLLFTTSVTTMFVRLNVGGGVPAVPPLAAAVTVYGPPALAFAVAVTLAMPLAIVAGLPVTVADAPPTGVTVKVTTPPSTGSLYGAAACFAVTLTTSGEEKAVPMAVDW